MYKVMLRERQEIKATNNQNFANKSLWQALCRIFDEERRHGGNLLQTSNTHIFWKTEIAAAPDYAFLTFIFQTHLIFSSKTTSTVIQGMI